MVYIGLDLGGTKISGALFTENNIMLISETLYLEGSGGDEVVERIFTLCDSLMEKGSIREEHKKCIGICVPGIAYSKTGKVWAPNIPGWDNYPLREKMTERYSNSTVMVESDRTCYILGESSQGVAKGCENAIFIAVGTGIGAGILIDGRVLHGASDIVGATGWMALKQPYDKEWDACGCFESNCSGSGIALQARKILKRVKEEENYNGVLSSLEADEITAREIFAALDQNDPVAKEVIDNAIEMWGMAAANFVSLFNPEMIIFGGGIFGPASKFVDQIYDEALKWAQPIAIRQCKFAATGLPDTAGLYGAGVIARLGHNSSMYGK
ncbi:MAG: ROK family protein [Bacteroidales bacterium]|jgi:glucokinase|nr:ROK family protein [Bacteroidales bacterium]